MGQGVWGIISALLLAAALGACLLAGCSGIQVNGPSTTAEMPAVWDDGKLFAFSGLEGPTSWANTLAGSATTEPLGILLHLNPDVRVAFASGVQDVDAELVLGDAVELSARIDGGSGKLRFAFVDAWTIIGETTGALATAVGPASADAVGDAQAPLTLVAGAQVDTGYGSLAFETEPTSLGERFCIALGPDGPEQAQARAAAGLGANLRDTIDQRSEFVRRLSAGGLAPGTDERTYRKCAEVLKLNARAAEGRFPHRWITPDVWPHRSMWLWDSAFASVGWLHLDSRVAHDCILSVLATQDADGFIPIRDAPVLLPDTPYSQPPILAWAAWKIYQDAGDQAFLVACYQPVCNFIEWLFQNRDPDGDGLLGWLENADGRYAGESGWDNSPRFEDSLTYDHIDLNSYAVREMRVLAQMAEVLGFDVEAAQWRTRADALGALINDQLWNETIGLYMDREPNSGEWCEIKTAACFLPMLAGIPDATRADRLVSHLTDPGQFWTVVPVPTVAADEPTYSDDMWRGPVWMNVNYMVWEGLLRYGYTAEADHLRRASMSAIQQWYEQAGCTFEFYDPENALHPYAMPRKGVIGDAGRGNIRDYNWTAAVYIAWANEG